MFLRQDRKCHGFREQPTRSRFQQNMEIFLRSASISLFQVVIKSVSNWPFFFSFFRYSMIIKDISRTLLVRYFCGTSDTSDTANSNDASKTSASVTRLWVISFYICLCYIIYWFPPTYFLFNPCFCIILNRIRVLSAHRPYQELLNMNPNWLTIFLQNYSHFLHKSETR